MVLILSQEIVHGLAESIREYISGTILL